MKITNATMIMALVLVLFFSTGSILSDKAYAAVLPWAGDTDVIRPYSTASVGDCRDTVITSDLVERMYKHLSSGSDSCTSNAWQFDISAIPDDAIIDKVEFRIDVDTVSNPLNCEVNDVAVDITTATTEQIWLDIKNEGGASSETYVNDDAFCTTTGNQKTLTLGSQANTDLQDNVSTTDIFAVGIWWENGDLADSQNHLIDWSDAELQVTYSIPGGIETDFTDYNVGVVGNVFNVTGKVEITSTEPNINFTNTVLKVNGTTIITNSTIQNFTGTDYYPINFGPFYWIESGFNESELHDWTVEVTAQNSTHTLTNSSNSIILSKEYIPSYIPALDPTQEYVNWTLSRSDDMDELHLKVLRADIAESDLFNFECIFQDSGQAFSTRNEEDDWQGTWINHTNFPYFNETSSGHAAEHVYITCFNDGELFTTTSYTNSSLALLGIDTFDDTYSEFLGVPIGVFFIVMAASMANKRTAPIWFIVLLAIAGSMATLGFFTLDPNVWAIALILAMLGLVVGQKIF